MGIEQCGQPVSMLRVVEDEPGSGCAEVPEIDDVLEVVTLAHVDAAIGARVVCIEIDRRQQRGRETRSDFQRHRISASQHLSFRSQYLADDGFVVRGTCGDGEG